MTTQTVRKTRNTPDTRLLGGRDPSAGTGPTSATRADGEPASGAGWRLGTVVVIAVAVCCRLVPTRRGGGLFGLGSYDDGVHMAAAIGWLHGARPYRDFLFLQPPGVLLALAPFAALGSVTSEGLGFAVARLAWVAMGALNAVLVTRIARPWGRRAALLGGLFYAVWWPAVYVERTTMLEGLGTLSLLLALRILAAADTRDRQVRDRRDGAGAEGPDVPGPHRLDRLRSHGWPVLAGLALGFGASVKIWGVLIALVVIAWQVGRSRRIRPVLPLVVGTVAGAVAVCLPFFLTAPGAMWRQVVLDQLGRGGPVRHWHRLGLLLGLDPLQLPRPVIGLVALVAVAGLVAAATLPAARLPVLLVVLFGLMLFQFTPNLFRQYPAVLAGPAALVVAAATSVVGSVLGSVVGSRVGRRRSPRAAGRLGVAALTFVVVALGCYALPLTTTPLGTRFPRSAFAAAIARTPGCVTSDEPTVLIELDQIGRTVERGCRLVVDYGGYAYNLPPGTPHRDTIRDTAGWQAALRSYLASGSAAFHLRNKGDGAAARHSWAVWRSWPVLARDGRYVLRRPPGS